MTSNLISLYTILRKEIQRFLRIWTQTLLPPVINQSLYFVIFGSIFANQNESGIKYIQFIIPGLIMMAVINSSYSNVVSSFFGSKFQKNIEELQVSPTPNWVILIGYSIGGMIRGILVGLIVFLVSMFFARPEVDNLMLVILFSLLSSITFALAGFTNALFAKKFDHISIVPTFVITPLTYLGGVFYSIKEIDPIWQTLSRLNPILYMVNGFRYSFFGISDVNYLVSLGMIVVFIIILFQVNLTLLNRGVGLRS